MTEQDMALLCKWLQDHQTHKLTWMEKEAVKLLLGKAKTVGDLAEAALKLLRTDA